MTEKSKSITDVSEFVRSIIQLGGVYKLDSSDYIVDATSGDVVVVDYGNKQKKPIMLWSEKARLGEHVLLNIFGETINTSNERKWFYTFVSMLPGFILKNIMTATVNLAIADKKGNESTSKYEVMDIVSPFVPDIDEKTKGELAAIDPAAVAVIVYHKPSKTAQLQTKLFDEDYRGSIGKKIRTKTWTLIENMFKTFMSVTDVAQSNSTFKYEATILGMKQTDAMLHVLVKFVENIEAYGNALIDLKPCTMTLVDGLANLNMFFAIMRVFSSGGGTTIEKSTEAKPNATPVTVVPTQSEVTPFGVRVPIQSKTNCTMINMPGDVIPICIPNVVKPGAPAINLNRSIPIYQQPQEIPTIDNMYGRKVVVGGVVSNYNNGPIIRTVLDNGKVV